MVNILVPTKPDDTHAFYAKLALEKIGHKLDIWCTADFPSQQTHSLEIVKDEIVWNVKGVECQVRANQYDVVWYRRPSKPILPDNLHHEDVDNARKENNMLFQTLWQVIQPNAVWINPANSGMRANSKLLQLKIASLVGMKIPKTLVSNDPENIKKYIQENAGHVIYKTLYPMAWLKSDEVRLTYTSQITVEDLPSDAVLQATPGIFQEKIEKQYELRVTYFGDRYVAVKINSQDHDKAKMDWRFAPTKELSLERVSLPDKLDQCCRKLMRELDLVFGCFDFIVTPEGEYYFLEINEQGQFLWIEEVNPEIKVLQSFVNFVGSYGRECEKDYSDISLMDFEDEMQKMKNHYERIHKALPLF